MSNISTFKDTFRGGVRPNQFSIQFFDTPAAPGGGLDLSLLAKASSIPASTIGNVDVPFRGRQLKVPGDRTFEDWTVTCFSNGDWSSRTAFEQWMQLIQGHRNPVRGVGANSVYGNAYVRQLDRQGRSLVTYVMEDVYPTNVAAIDLDWGTNDAVEEFQVTFAVNNWFTSELAEPAAGGSGGQVDIGVSATIGKSGVDVSAAVRGVFGI